MENKTEGKKTYQLFGSDNQEIKAYSKEEAARLFLKKYGKGVNGLEVAGWSEDFLAEKINEIN